MTIDELIRKDTSFNESEFISKVNIVLIKTLSSIMLDNLNSVKHFLSPEVVDKVNLEIKNYKDKNECHMYDELNVSNTKINKITEDNEYYYIETSSTVKYLDYIISLDNNELVSGDNNNRIEKNYILSFKKLKSAVKANNVMKCPYCGNSL